jgi:hypothetical protein
MVAYVQQIAKDLAERFGFQGYSRTEGLQGRAEVLKEELDRLDPRDFSPDARFDFVDARRQVRDMARRQTTDWERVVETIRADRDEAKRINDAIDDPRRLSHGGNETTGALRQNLEEVLGRVKAEVAKFDDAARLCQKVAGLLDSHDGRGSRAVTRTFGFVRNASLREIIERDYRELSQVLFPDCAWKSTVVTAGSILEAVLHDLLTRDEERIRAAMKFKKPPKKDITKEQWTLNDLINVSVDLGLLPPESDKTIHQVLREYRNFIHPLAEVKAKYACVEAEALMAKGALDAVCNYLEAAALAHGAAAAGPTSRP